MKYKGKRGVIWLLVLMVYQLAFVWCIVKRDSYQGFWMCIVLLLLGDILLLALNARTYVMLEKKTMTVVLGFAKLVIDCDKIHSVEKSKSPIASMALSFERLKILYGNDCVYVSVQNNDELVKGLVAINPSIKVK